MVRMHRQGSVIKHHPLFHITPLTLSLSWASGTPASWASNFSFSSFKERRVVESSDSSFHPPSPSNCRRCVWNFLYTKYRVIFMWQVSFISACWLIYCMAEQWQKCVKWYLAGRIRTLSIKNEHEQGLDIFQLPTARYKEYYKYNKIKWSGGYLVQILKN